MLTGNGRPVYRTRIVAIDAAEYNMMTVKQQHSVVRCFNFPKSYNAGN